MDDLIKRKDAIDAMTDDNIIRNMDSVYDSALHRIKRSITRILAGLPSAKPNTKEHSQHVESVGCVGDTISRQAAIDIVEFGCEELLGVARRITKKIEQLPSAQPEPLTDKEQRIFLSAMSREEEVCKQVDNEWRDCREPYDDSLVRTCHEITRKVKGALWT